MKPNEIVDVFNKNYGIIFKTKFTKGLGIDVNKILFDVKINNKLFCNTQNKYILEELRYAEILDTDNILSNDMLMSIDDELKNKEIIVFSPETKLLKKSEIVLNLNR